MKKKLPPTEREREALTWIKSNYRNWRKRFNESLAEHTTRRPPHIEAAQWRFWYFYPFGIERWNVNVMIVRRLLREGRV